MMISDIVTRAAAAWLLTLSGIAGCGTGVNPSHTDERHDEAGTQTTPAWVGKSSENDPTAAAEQSAREAADSGEQSRSAVQEPQTTQVTAPGIVRWVNVAELPIDLAIMDSVFWEPADTISLRQRISSDPRIRDALVLEIGTGSGLVALCCLQFGAASAVATDLNPTAVANAVFNAERLMVQDRLDVRRVPRRSPEAWTVIRPDERFDLIVSNPPWENSRPESVEEFALYDPDFRLLTSLVSGARTHLNPGGRMWLAYGCVSAIREIQRQAAAGNLTCTILDDRSLEDLPEVFLPGMLIEIQVPGEPANSPAVPDVSGGE